MHTRGVARMKRKRGGQRSGIAREIDDLCAWWGEIVRSDMGGGSSMNPLAAMMARGTLSARGYVAMPDELLPVDRAIGRLAFLLKRVIFTEYVHPANAPREEKARRLHISTDVYKRRLDTALELIYDELNAPAS